MLTTIDETTDLGLVQQELNADQEKLNQRSRELAAEVARRKEREHQEMVRQCRAAKDEYERLVQQADSAYQEWFHNRYAAENALRLYHEWAGAKPRPGEYPTGDELLRWQKELDRRNEAATLAKQREGESWGRYDRLRVERNRANEKLKDLAFEEAEMRSALGSHSGPRITLTFDTGTETSMTVIR